MVPFGSFFSRGPLLLVMALMYTDAGKVFSLEEKVDLYVSDLAEEKGAEVLWWDMHGKHDILINNAKYRRYKVNVAAGSIEYRSGEKVTEEKHHVTNVTIPNEHQMDWVKITFNATSVLKHSWTVESAFDYGKGPLVVKAKESSLHMADGSEPEVSNGESWGVDLTTVKKQSYKRTEGFVLNSVIFTVHPTITVQFQRIVTTFSQKVPWTSVVAVGGFFAVWFKTKVNGNNLWFCPVTVLEDPLLEHVRPEELRFVVYGRYEGARIAERQGRLKYEGPQNVSTVNGTVASPGSYHYAEVQLPLTGKYEAKTCEVARSGPVSFRTRSPVFYILLATNVLTMTVRDFP